MSTRARCTNSLDLDVIFGHVYGFGWWVAVRSSAALLAMSDGPLNPLVLKQMT